MILLRLLVLPLTESNMYTFEQKMCIFFTVILKEHLRIQEYILQNMLTKGKAIFIAFKALQCQSTQIIYQKKRNKPCNFITNW